MIFGSISASNVRLLVLVGCCLFASVQSFQWLSTTFTGNKNMNCRIKQRLLTVVNVAGRTPMVPYYLDKGRREYMWLDIYNSLGRDRTLFVSRYLDEETANQLISSLVYLGSKSSSDPIRIYFNIPGAMAKPTLAVYDVLRTLSCPVETINMGLTVGLGCLLVAAGTNSKRLATPNARFLMGRAGLDDGIHGQSSDIALQVKEVHILHAYFF